MSWKWTDLTAAEFTQAAKDARGLCVVPMGVLEKHGEHLPLGTDMLTIQAIAERAVELEPAVLFPTYYISQGHETKAWPGAVALRHELLFAVLENLCEEIARNGLRKILLLNGHGGNESFLASFNFAMLERPRDFTLYVARLADFYSPPLADPEWKAMMQSDFDEHAGEVETSMGLALHPHLVKMDAVAAPGLPQRRLAGLPASTPLWWYADYPRHYAGDASFATPEKGRFLLERMVARVAAIIKAVKEDTEAPRLQAEYEARLQHG